MSLINDALKKAQKQRTGEAPPLASMPAIGGETAANIARRAKPASLNTLLVRLGIGAGVVVIVLVAGMFFFRQPAAEAPVDQPAVVAQTSSAPTTATPVPATPAPGPAQAKPAETVFVLPIATPPAEKPASPAAGPAPKSDAPKPAAPGAPAETARVEPAPAPVAPARLEPRAVTFIESIRVAGIRASATDSKVLMNDRVYRIGNTVEAEMGLRLVEITANSLTFEDERGGRYTRHF